MRFIIGLLAFFCFMGLGLAGLSQEPPISDDTSECLECHATIHPGLVAGWKKSRHARITPKEALSVKGLAKKVSSPEIPDDLQDHVVGCAECHKLRPEAHKDTFDHNDHLVHGIVSPGDCAVCHGEEAAQFQKNLMSHAYGNLVKNDVYQILVRSINDTPLYEEGRLKTQPAAAATGEESCLYCHGTELRVTGQESRETELGEMTFPVIAGWPNAGVGRINLDGSLGSCSACHTRHAFSIETARKPYTCKECHVGPDVPAFKVYAASRHGKIYASAGADWDFSTVPWTAGKDFTAPTCATCHISLVVNGDGEVINERSHEVKNRLPWRIFGLIYAHPHPKDPDTTIIKNEGGLQLPTDFNGGFAARYLMDEGERAEAREAMQATCRACHDLSLINGHWDRFVHTISETNAVTLAGTRIMSEIWEKGYAAGLNQKESPFDEYIEKIWSDLWLFDTNTIRFASAMGGGGDYGVFAGGRYHARRTVSKLYDWMSRRQPPEK